VCCWTKTGNPQIIVKTEDFLTTGEVAGHGGGGPAPPPPGPGEPPLAPLPPPGKTIYNTLVYTYEWPTSDTPRANAGTPHGQTLTGRLEELNSLRDRRLITPEEYTKARRAALGISGV
jgi:hypothetical protein